MDTTTSAVPEIPDNSTQTLESSFKGFNFGVYAQTEGIPASINYININSSLFEDNGRGIYMLSIENPTIVKNDFFVRNKYSAFDANYAEYEMTGLYLDELTTGFTVKENNFYTDIYYEDLYDKECNGITINNSGEGYNEIYNNTFHMLTVGIAAGGTNRGEDNDNSGLCILCNDFSRTLTDVYVCTADEPTGDKEGIAYLQGDEAPVPSGNEYDPTYAAGNIFSKETYLILSNYTKKPGCEQIEYTYHGIYSDVKVRPKPTDPPQDQSGHILLIPDGNVGYESKESACPSNYGSGGIDVVATTQALAKESENVIAYLDTLNNTIDGGNTTALNLDVAASTPSGSLALRQQLLDESPFLSDTVMKSAIYKENVLNNAMLRDVLVANPQSAKSTRVINTIDKRNTTMPDYMMDEIMQGAGIEGGKDILTKKLSHHSALRDKAMTSIIKHYISDTSCIKASRDSIISIMQNSLYIKPHYRLAAIYLDNNDSVNAFNELYSIENNFNLTVDEETEHDLFVELAGIQWELKTNPVQHDSTSINKLFNIAANPETAPGIYARNILISMGLVDYTEPVYFPERLKIQPIFSYNNSTEISDSFLKIFPNPAKDYFTAQTKIINDFSTA